MTRNLGEVSNGVPHGEGAWAHPEFGKLIGKVVSLLEFYSAGENLCKKI
tara:strand:- start:534 stop:680 length:147 start_codon:yes stop_codon:yes gene_type:complete